MSVILKNKVRVLTPAEYEDLLQVITKDSLKKLVRVLMLTGMRYQEVLRLKNNCKGCFQPDRKVIHFKSGKKGAVHSERYIHLTPQGVTAVQAFLDDERATYPTTQGMTINLQRWAEQAGLTPSPELEGMTYDKGANAGDERLNVWGMSVKSFRKSWESWLAVSFPQQLELIALSQGHLTGTSMAHYLAVPFSPAEKEQIKGYTAGWMDNAR
jgi:integrase